MGDGAGSDESCAGCNRVLLGAMLAQQALDAAFGDGVLLGELPLRGAVLERIDQEANLSRAQPVDNAAWLPASGGRTDRLVGGVATVLRSLDLLHRSDQGVCQVRPFRVSGNKVHSFQDCWTLWFTQVGLIFSHAEYLSIVDLASVTVQ